MTARQIIDEIELLPLEDKREVFATLQGRLQEEKSAYETPGFNVRYLDAETARPMIREIMDKHADLFQKLAQ